MVRMGMVGGLIKWEVQGAYSTSFLRICEKAVNLFLYSTGANVHVKQQGTLATALHFALGPARADKFEEVWT